MGAYLLESHQTGCKRCSYLTEDEDEKAVDQGMKDSEKEENTDSKQRISEEIPAVTAEPMKTIPRLSKIYQQQQQGTQTIMCRLSKIVD